MNIVISVGAWAKMASRKNGTGFLVLRRFGFPQERDKSCGCGKTNPAKSGQVVPFVRLPKITRLSNFSFSCARESLRLFELKKIPTNRDKSCGGENKKHRRVGPDSNRDRLTRCPFEIWYVCWSPVKMVYFFYVSVVCLLLSCRLLRLLVTFLPLAFVRDFGPVQTVASGAQNCQPNTKAQLEN